VSRRDAAGEAPDGEGFLSRWSRLKRDSADPARPPEPPGPVADAEEQAAPPRVLTDADMPDLDSLTEESDFSGFLSPEVSEELRQLALRKLFHGPAFNLRDGLDDYDDDFTSFVRLGDLITADMRHQMEQEAKRLQESLDETPPAPESALAQAADAKEPAAPTEPAEADADDLNDDEDGTEERV